MAILLEEIIIEILSWLPVKSLLRFMSVCKGWLSQISKPNFTQLHLSRSPSCIIIHNSVIYNSDSHIYKLSLSNLLVPFEEHAVKLEPRPSLPSCYISRSSANGIVRLGGYAGEVEHGEDPVPTYLWNPATKQCKELRPPCHRYLCASLGFGFDSISSDYKVLRMGWKGNKCWIRGEIWSPKTVVEVYSSKSDSWRKIELKDLQLQCEELGVYYAPYPSCRATVKGVQYWDGFVSVKKGWSLGILLLLLCIIQLQKNWSSRGLVFGQWMMMTLDLGLRSLVLRHFQGCLYGF